MFLGATASFSPKPVVFLIFAFPKILDYGIISYMKRFNVTGTCFADRHYMVNIDERIQKIKKMVDRGDYFCINRGRQYGKTTALHFLKKALDSEYTVFSISFEGSGDKSFESLDSLVNYFF